VHSPELPSFTTTFIAVVSRNTAKALLDTQLQCSMGALLATYDVDTQLMFLAVRVRDRLSLQLMQRPASPVLRIIETNL